MKYLYIDGDNIGLKIEQSFLNNDELSLKEINHEVKNNVEIITTFLIENKQKIIFSGADGIICKGEDLNISQLLDFIRQNNFNLTFTIGIGRNLKESYIALRYAKSLSKNIAVEIEDLNFKIIDGILTKNTNNIS